MRNKEEIRNEEIWLKWRTTATFRYQTNVKITCKFFPVFFRFTRNLGQNIYFVIERLDCTLLKKWAAFWQERIYGAQLQNLVAITRDTSRERERWIAHSASISVLGLVHSTVITAATGPFPPLFQHLNDRFPEYIKPLYPCIGHRSTNSVTSFLTFYYFSPAFLPPSFFVLLRAYLERNQVE